MGGWQDRPIGSLTMKKLLVLAVLVGLGLVAARRLRSD